MNMRLDQILKTVLPACLLQLISLGYTMEMSSTPSVYNSEIISTRIKLSVEWPTKLCPSEITQIFESNSQLTELSLFCMSLNEDSIKLLFEGIRASTTLKTLCLRQNGIGIEEVQNFTRWLAQNTTLKSLSLTSNSFKGGQGDLAAQAFATMLLKNTTLSYLSLHDNKIGPDGFGYIAEALQVNTTLSTLVLSYNHIAWKGWEDWKDGIYPQIGVNALSTMLQTNTTLKKLSRLSILKCPLIEGLLASILKSKFNPI